MTAAVAVSHVSTYLVVWPGETATVPLMDTVPTSGEIEHPKALVDCHASWVVSPAPIEAGVALNEVIAAGTR